MNVELFLSEVEMSLIAEHDLNVPRICIEAITAEMEHRNALKQTVSNLDRADENRRLKEQLTQLQRDLDAARQEKVPPVIQMHYVKSRFT